MKKLNQRGEAVIAIIIIGMIWGVVATIATQTIHSSSHKSAIVEAK